MLFYSSMLLLVDGHSSTVGQLNKISFIFQSKHFFWLGYFKLKFYCILTNMNLKKDKIGGGNFLELKMRKYDLLFMALEVPNPKKIGKPLLCKEEITGCDDGNIV